MNLHRCNNGFVVRKLRRHVINVKPDVVVDGGVDVLSIFVVEEVCIVVRAVEDLEASTVVVEVQVFVEDEYGAAVVVFIDCVGCEVEKVVVVIEGSKIDNCLP